MAKTQKNQNGLTLVMQRNDFYRDAYRRVVLALLLVLAVNCGLGAVFVYRALNPPKPAYFPTTPSGVIINIHPLTDPVVTDSFVLQWTANAVRNAFSQDYVHWRKQLQDASTAFTVDGWHYFLNAMKSSNNLKTLVDGNMVSSAELTGAPQITAKMVVDGHYAWKVEMPLLITYTNGTNNKITMPWNVTVIVLREPVANYPDRIAINNFLPEVRKTEV